MRSKRIAKLLVIAALLISGLILSAGVQWVESSFRNNAQERKKRNLKEEVLTVIDAAPDELDAEKKAARTVKNKRFNTKRTSLLEQEDGSFSGILLESPPPPPLPVTSDLVIVGNIQRRQPYLSDNITIVYTEFTVHIEEILKNHASSPVYASQPLIINRQGGAIRMPSGRVFRYLVDGIGSMPEVGKRYVLFLQREKDQDYKIVVGYELTDKEILPLEDFADRDPIRALTETQFLSLLRQKISEIPAEKEN